MYDMSYMTGHYLNKYINYLNNCLYYHSLFLVYITDGFIIKKINFLLTTKSNNFVVIVLDIFIDKKNHGICINYIIILLI